MLLHQPRFRHPDKALCPPNLAEAEHLAPGLTPVYPGFADLIVDVETADGGLLAIDSPERERLRKSSDTAGELTLLRSDRAMTDCAKLHCAANDFIRSATISAA